MSTFGYYAADAHAAARRRLVCGRCGASYSALERAQRGCAWVTSLVGPDPLRLRFGLALRSAPATDAACAQCEGWGAHVFHEDVECVYDVASARRMRALFGAAVSLAAE